MKPLITVIIPIYGVEDCIAQCMLSVLHQSYKKLEILCVNDATMDNSIARVKDIAKSDSRVQIIHNEINRGLGGARNAGLDKASGDFVYFLDPDDWLEPRAIETLVLTAVTNRADWVAYQPILDFGKWAQPIAPFHCVSVRQLAILGSIQIPQHLSILSEIWPSMWISLRSRKIIERYHIRFQELLHFEDHYFHYAYGSYSQRFAYYERPLYHHRRNREGQITADSSRRILEIFEVISSVRQIFEERLALSKTDISFLRFLIRVLAERYLRIPPGTEVQNQFLSNSKKLLVDWKFAEIVEHAPPWVNRLDISALAGKRSRFWCPFTKLTQ